MDAFLAVKPIRNCLQLRDISRDTPPGNILEGWVALAVQSEVCIIQSFNEPVSALEAVAAPRLDGEWLVQVVFVACLFVGLFNFGLDGIGRRKGPEDQGFQ